MKRVLVFIGLKVVELLGLVLIAFIVMFAIIGINKIFPTFTQLIYNWLGWLVRRWWYYLIMLPGFIIALIVNWEWAGEICEKKFNKKA